MKQYAVRNAIQAIHYLQPTRTCLLKVDFRNAFNECNRVTLLNETSAHFPDIAAWVLWSYCVPAELRFGDHHLKSSSLRHPFVMAIAYLCITRPLHSTDAVPDAIFGGRVCYIDMYCGKGCKTSSKVVVAYWLAQRSDLMMDQE